MTDGEVIEAAARGMCKNEGTAQCAPICLSHFSIHTTNGQCPEAIRIWGRKARAAIAAADKVRAEGFDELWQELVEKDDRTSPAEYPDMALITREELRRAFAAGLAQGEAERAALREALKQVEREADRLSEMASLGIARSALALVRKGV